MPVKFRTTEWLALMLVAVVVAFIFCAGVVAGRAPLLDDLEQANVTATEAQAIADDAIEAAAKSADEVTGLEAIIQSLETSISLMPDPEAVPDVTSTPDATGTIAPQSVAPADTKPAKVTAYKAAQAALAPVSHMTWPTRPFATKAACGAHYRGRMTYWLDKYGVLDAHNLAHCLSIIWGESKGDCDARNASDHVGLAQYSRDWWTSGADWRMNGDTNLRRLAKAIAEGGHDNLVDHWSATMGACVR